MKCKKEKIKKVEISIVMGSDSDEPVMAEAEKALDLLGIPYETRIMSAHRTPERVVRYVKNAPARGVRVFIAGAGAAAHLAGAIASHTVYPVIGVPLATSSLDGMDALLATVQMPRGIPVGTVALGKSGAHNAALLAAQILSISDNKIRSKLMKYRRDLAESVKIKDRLKQKKKLKK